ncbi:MAG: transcriptional regulator, TetR family [Frankiales bacterium]|nr:transcriptional regulator, TetR family [Frankiales bacterium]
MTTTAPASGRSASTRGSLLSAARSVFAASGFTEASVADVVAGAGASVGSLYHHFGGKADLYLALFEEYSARQEERASAAVRAARAGGERDPVALFVAGARGYLEGSWAERDLARLFLAGGGPPGFELTARRRYREWTVLNASLLRVGQQPWGDAVVLVLTTVVREAGHEVAVCDDEQAATALADEFLDLIARIGRR